MATYTDNYQLEKPVASDAGNVAVLNRNSDKIDTILHASQVSIADAYDETATYNTGDVVMYEFFLYECLDDNVTGTWDATKWQRTTAATSGSSGGASALTDLTDVAVSSPSNGQVLKYDSTSGKWVNGTGGGGSSTLAGLTDVTITSPTDGQGLIWDATAGEWVNGTSGGDFAGAAFIDTDNVIIQLTALPSSVTEYTATEDCYLYVQLGGQNQINYVNIDGERVFYSNPTNWQMEGGLIPLAKGQTAEIHGRQTSDSYAVYGVKYSGGSSGGGISYSTTEQDTGLKWIDGSAIYQKTIDFGTMPSNDEKDVAHGISDLAFVVDMEFIVYNSTQGQWRLMPSVSRGNIQAQSVYGVNSQYVFVLGGQNADVDSNWTGTVTLRYTKSSAS